MSETPHGHSRAEEKNEEREINPHLILDFIRTEISKIYGASLDEIPAEKRRKNLSRIQNELEKVLEIIKQM